MPKMMSPNTAIWWVPFTGTRTVADGVTTISSTTVTSATAAFTAADVGAPITGTGIPANATIASVTNATTVAISAAATATGASVSITVVSFNPVAPKITFLTDARNISKAIVNGYTLNPTKSDVDTSTNITDTSKVETPVRYNYEANITFNRESDQAATTTAYARAFDFFKSARTPGFLVRRTGYLDTVAAVAGHKVDSFKLINDVPKDMVEDNLINFATKFSPQGVMELNTALVA